MPYASVKSLPAATKDLTPHQRRIFRAAFNASYAQYKGDEQKAFATAWAATKKHGAKDAAWWGEFITDDKDEKGHGSYPRGGGLGGIAGKWESNWKPGYAGSQATQKTFEVGKTYVQKFSNGDQVFFTPTGRLKNGNWTGTSSRQDAGGRATSPKKATVPHPPIASWEEHHSTKDASPPQEITLTVPLLIRLMEFGREDAKDDIDIHNMAERIAQSAGKKDCLESGDYEKLTDAKSDDDEDESDGKKEIKVKVKVKLPSKDAKPVPWSKFMDEFRIAHGDAGYSPDQLRHHKSGRWTGGVFKPQEISRSQIERKKKRPARDQGLVSTGWSSLNPTSPAEKSMPPISPAESARQELARPTLGNGNDRQKRKIPPASHDDNRQKRNIKPVTDPMSEYPSPSGAEHVQYLETRRKRRAKDSKPWWQKFTNSNGDNQ